MDINSLLSPSDSPAGTPTPQPAPAAASPSLLRSPGKRTRRQMPSRTPSGLSQQVISSPQPPPHQSLQQRGPSPGFTHMPNGARPVHSTMGTPQQVSSPRDARMTPPNPMYRQTSTPGMDTLAGRLPAFFGSRCTALLPCASCMLKCGLGYAGKTKLYRATSIAATNSPNRSR